MAEVHVMWWLIQGAAPALLMSFIVEGANRLVAVVFKVVPLRTGVDEAATGFLTRMLGFGATLGTTMAIVRKIRTIAWVTGRDVAARRGARYARAELLP